MTTASIDDNDIFDVPDGFTLPPVHPGETLAEEMRARDLTANALALKLRVPANRITEIMRGRRGISAETALRLGIWLETGAAFWVNLQAQWDLAVAERDHGDIARLEVART